MIFGLHRFLSMILLVFSLINYEILYGEPVSTKFNPITRNSDFSLLLTATPDTICPGMSSQLVAVPVGGAPPFSYSWSPESGLDDPTSPDPIASPTATITYVVTATDAFMQTVIDSIEIFVKSPPETPGPISGPGTPCKDSIGTYIIAEVYESTSYSWTVPEGDTIIDGQNTRQVKIKWSGMSGQVSVIAGNECGTSNPSILSITLIQIPVITGNIEGPESACEQEKLTFSIAESPEATNYIWAVPRDAAIDSGQGTTAIHVTWGNTPGDIMVTPENQCSLGEPGSKSILLENVPAHAGAIIGKDTVCLSHSNYTYSIPPIPETISYRWYLPVGATITDGEGTDSITVSFGLNATSGTITVYGENHCGSGAESFKDIIVDPCAGIKEVRARELFHVYPNPANTEITIAVSENVQQNEILITDITGKVQLFEERNSFSPLKKIMKINISKLAPGIYFIRLKSDNNSLIRKLIVQ